jgi:hypothetical protein
VPKRYIRGDRAFGRLIKQLPESVTSELRAQLNSTGRLLLAQERRRAPVRTGKLQAALSYQVAPKRLNLKVGLIGKAINRKLFYGLFVEQGRHGGGRGVKRKSAKYAAGVGATPAHHFVWVAGLREQIYPAFREIWTRALTKAGQGSSDD